MNAVVEEVLRNASAERRTWRPRSRPALPPAPADPLVLRRVLENLVGNAVDSLAGRADGVVTVATEAAGARRGRAGAHDGGGHRARA